METVSASVISVFSWASTELSQTSILIDVIVYMFTDGLVISFISCSSMLIIIVNLFTDSLVCSSTLGQHWRTE